MSASIFYNSTGWRITCFFVVVAVVRVITTVFLFHCDNHQLLATWVCSSVFEDNGNFTFNSYMTYDSYGKTATKDIGC